MKRFFLPLVLLIAAPFMSKAQGENNIWTFGFEANTAINFNLPVPAVDLLPNVVPSNTSHWAGAVCYPNGQLRFFVRLKFNFGTTPEYYIYDPAGDPIDGSDLNTDAGSLDFSMPVIIPRPGNGDQYYVFHCKDDGLFYSLLDMSLNGGQGSVVASEKNVSLTPPGSVFTRLITAVKGCSGTWLVIRSQTSNEYYSYHVTASGIDTQKVVSVIGNFPLLDYAFGGFLKASPDGSMLATTNWAGVEWYDFEQCSGKITNARVLDTTGNPALFPGASVILPSHKRYTGVCFSPDNSKLYVTRNQFVNYEVAAGDLFQFDLSMSNLSAVIASKTLILTNQPSLGENLATMSCDLIVPNPLGEIRRGPDGKLYIDNGSCTCLDTANVPPGYNPGPAFHAIDAPDLAGLACLPSFNRILTPASVCFYSSGYPVSFLQNEIVISPSTPDTLAGALLNQTTCFKDSLLLAADPAGHCYLWDDGSREEQRWVYTDGKYYVSYFKDCNYVTDTIIPTFIKVPVLEVESRSCENNATGKLSVSFPQNQNINFKAVWKDASGDTLQDHTANNTDAITGLHSGLFSVRVITSQGCDTVLHAEVLQFPDIEVFVSPADTMIRYGDSVTLNASGADLYVWWPSGLLDSATKANPVARPLEPTLFTVMGLSEYGCVDTGYVQVNIDYSMPDFVPNAFSPNGDGLNDVFRIEGLTYQKVKQFKIFNRFGNELFTTRDAMKGWNGTQGGKPCDSGTYFYLIELVYPDGKIKTYKGDVILIR